jgi:amino-acid N-acetyltransferase
MPTPAIRPARAADADACAAIIQRHVPSGALVPRSADYIAERDVDFLVATVDDRVVGCIHLSEYSPSLAEVRSLAVEPELADAGVDAALLDAAERLAARRQYTTIFAVTNDETFYRGRGYAPFAIPELAREREEVSRFAGVFAKELGAGISDEG